MSLDLDALLLRRRLTRRLAVWRIVAVVALAGLGLALYGVAEAPEAGGDRVARLDVDGVIVDDRWRIATLDALADDEHVKALLVHIDSPGGSVVGGETLFAALRRVAATRPVIAVMGEVAASGGYMAAIAADRIYARSGSITGSIGVIMQTAEMTGLFEKLGIVPESIKSTPLKATPNPLEPMTDEARTAARSLVLDMYEMFVGMVAERRNLTPEAARRLADGRIYTGRQAAENGLVDAIGGEIEALDWLAETHGIDRDLPVEDVKIDRPLSRWQRLFEAVAGKPLFSEELTQRLSLDGLLALWQPRL